MAYAYVTDPSAILRGGAALLPDLAAQMAQARQLGVQEQQVALETAKFGEERDRARAYAADLMRMSALPLDQQPAATIALMRKYPKESEALKRSYDAQDERAKAADFKQAAELLSYVQNGSPERAAEVLRKRIGADRAAQQDTSDDEAVLEELESGDPVKINRAAGKLLWLTANAAGLDKFASVYGALEGKKTEFEKQWDFIRGKYGAKAANTYAQNRIDPIYPVTTQDGTTAFRSSQLMAGDAPSPIDEQPQQAQSPSPSVVSEDEGTQLLSQARVAKLISPEDLERLKAALEPQGHGALDRYLKKFGIQVGREVNGKRYVKRGNDWYEVK